MCEDQAMTVTPGTPCSHGHVFIYSDGGWDIQGYEGMPCACGRYTAHWVTCEACGQRRMELVPVEGNRETS